MHHRTVSQPIATTSFLHDQERPEKVPQSNSRPAGGSLVGAPTLIDFLHAVPAPLVVLLVRLAPPLASLRYFAQILSWQTPWVDCWLLLAGWWAAVLFTDWALRYFLFVMICSALMYFRRRQPPQQYNTDAPNTMTEASIQTAMGDLAALLVLLPSSPTLPTFLSSSTLPSAALFRACALASIPYLIVTYLVPVRLLVGLIGTIIMTYRAPFAQLLRAALWRSAFVRWTVYRSWAGLTGIPITYPIPPADATVANKSAHATVTTRVQFAFMVYENQRWWMGLDWTAALLPGERPSWCSVSQTPLPPPAAFALPAPTTAFLPVDGPPDAREQRMATWAWAEPEWRVVVRRDADLFADAVEDVESSAEETDADGWVYGDNKWEGHSGKGGLGKYTRHRRWTRIAILTESMKRVGPGPTGVLREGGQLQPLDTLAGGEVREKTSEKEKEKVDNSPRRRGAPLERRTPVVLGAVGNGLRQRLQAAVSGSH